MKLYTLDFAAQVILADDETIDMTGRAKRMQATLVHSLLLWLGQWLSNCIQDDVYCSL